jgi:hypothetical protein
MGDYDVAHSAPLRVTEGEAKAAGIYGDKFVNQKASQALRCVGAAADIE